MHQGITVLIPTYNRANILRETLSAFCKANNNAVSVEYIIIDNNSTDHTRETVQEFKDKLPIVYLHESKPGKNCALNYAVRTIELREIVAFADDDISPNCSWLTEITNSAKEHVDVDVWGARIVIKWPHHVAPAWATESWICTLAFAAHDLGTVPIRYQGELTPMGPLYWVRKRVFSKVPGFNEDIGPRPKNRIMGSEVSHLLDLRTHGFNMLYYPAVVVQHRVEASACEECFVKKRAVRYGRGEVKLFGIHRRRLLDRSGLLWHAAMLVDAIFSFIRLIASVLLINQVSRVRLAISARLRLGKIYQSYLELNRTHQHNGN